MAAAQAKIKLYKELEEMKRKVAATDKIGAELAACKKELERRDGLQEEMDQWKQDFADMAKQTSLMKRETGEAKELVMLMRRRLKAAEEEEESLSKELNKLKANYKIAESTRKGVLAKFGNQEKQMTKMKKENFLHDQLRVGAEEELRRTKQFLDQERSYRLVDLHRHNELNGEYEALEEEKDRVEGEKYEAVREGVQNRVEARGLKAAIEVKHQMGLVLNTEVEAQQEELTQQQYQISELKRVLQEKTNEISTWAERFTDLEGEYGRVQRRLALIARSNGEKNETVTKGRLAKNFRLEGFSNSQPSNVKQPTMLSKINARDKLPDYKPPNFADERQGGSSMMTQPYYSLAQAGDSVHQSGGVYPSQQMDSMALTGTEAGMEAPSAAQGHTFSASMKGSANQSGYSVGGSRATNPRSARLSQGKSTYGVNGSLYVSRGLGMKKLGEDRQLAESGGSAKHILQKVLRGLDMS
jgi:chromosome segregation ATPase